MSVVKCDRRFEMPSTSGSNCSSFEVEQGPTGTLVRLRYRWTVCDEESFVRDVNLVPVPTRRDKLSRLLEETRRYGRTIGQASNSPHSVDVDVAVPPNHTLRIEILPRSPEIISAPWQAVFVIYLTTGASFEFVAKYAIDATCLDMFNDELAECLESMSG